MIALCLYEDNRIHHACAIIHNGKKLNDSEVKEIYPEGNYHGMPIVDTLPEGNLPDYFYINRKYVYDPRPKQEPVEPAPELTVWDELDAAYQEGVDSV